MLLAPRSSGATFLSKTALCGALAISLAVAASPGVADAQKLPDRAVTKKTSDGVTVIAAQRNGKVDPVPPLDSSPFTREAFLAGTNSVTVIGAPGDAVSGVFESGYQIGVPAIVGNDGADVKITTPNLSINGGLNSGVNASVTPSISGGGTFGPSGGSGNVNGGVSGTVGGNAGSNVGAQSNIVPSQNISFKVEHGRITEVPVVRFNMTRPQAYADLTGVHIFVNAAAGPATVRPYTRVVTQTASGVATVIVYGDTVRI